MNETSKILSLIAYYLSKYDMEAVKTMGYASRTEAFHKISVAFRRDNNYLKLRRDEFDVLTNSSRKGWRNRPPATEVVTMANYLKSFTFADLSSMVCSFIENSQPNREEDIVMDIGETDSESNPTFSEEEIERILNIEDPTADVIIKTGKTTRRVYKRSIIFALKHLYKDQCQICGTEFGRKYGTVLSEAHHINFFSETHDNHGSNIIILCPNHHRIIHQLKPIYNRDSQIWVYPNGVIESLVINNHL